MYSDNKDEESCVEKLWTRRGGMFPIKIYRIDSDHVFLSLWAIHFQLFCYSCKHNESFPSIIFLRLMKSLYLIFSEVCDFDDSPCSWNVGNWTKRKGNVPSEGTGPRSKDVDGKCTGHG